MRRLEQLTHDLSEIQIPPFRRILAAVGAAGALINLSGCAFPSFPARHPEKLSLERIIVLPDYHRQKAEYSFWWRPASQYTVQGYVAYEGTSTSFHKSSGGGSMDVNVNHYRLYVRPTLKSPSIPVVDNINRDLLTASKEPDPHKVVFTGELVSLSEIKRNNKNEKTRFRAEDVYAFNVSKHGFKRLDGVEPQDKELKASPKKADN